jgi:prepilin-type N-terminal cleavage/methylation domain-containing protein
MARKNARQRGLSLVELMIAVAVLAIVVVGISMGFLQSSALMTQTREYDIAVAQAVATANAMRSYQPFDEIYRAYNSDTTDDSSLTNSVNAPGNRLPIGYAMVPNVIDPHLSDQDSLVTASSSALDGAIPNEMFDASMTNNYVEIIFPETGNQLDETQTGPPWWDAPRSLDDDTSANDTLNSGYYILPVTIRVVWQPVRGGSMSYELHTVLTPTAEEFAVD